MIHPNSDLSLAGTPYGGIVEYVTARIYDVPPPLEVVAHLAAIARDARDLVEQLMPFEGEVDQMGCNDLVFSSHELLLTSTMGIHHVRHHRDVSEFPDGFSEAVQRTRPLLTADYRPVGIKHKRQLTQFDQKRITEELAMCLLQYTDSTYNAAVEIQEHLDEGLLRDNQ